MKKRFLLTVIPALLVLSSCGIKPSVKAEPIFQEDTLAHEEIFGGEDSGRLIRGTKLSVDNYDQQQNNDSRPNIGIQSYEKDGYISIRFVAAVKISGELSSASAVWTRAMYNPDGSILKDFADKPCQKVYEEINDHGTKMDIAQYNGLHESHYNYFVVYTMLNIKKADYRDCYLNAYLTLGDGKQTKVLATQVEFNNNTTYLFEPSQRYFLRVNPGNQQYEIAQDATTQGDNPQNNYASFTASLTDGDEFIIIANDVANKRFRIYDASSLKGDVSNFAFSNANGKFKANLDENFVLYLNKAGEVWTSVSGEHYQLFINDVLSSIENAVPTGWADNAVFSNVAITSIDSTLKVKLNGTVVSQKEVHGIGNYIVGLNSGNAVWANLSGENTLYFSKPADGWTDVYLYAWDSNNSSVKNHDWPGLAMSDTGATNELGQKIYSMTLDLSLYNTIIINNGSGTQSGNTSVSGLVYNAFYYDGSNALGQWAYAPAA